MGDMFFQNFDEYLNTKGIVKVDSFSSLTSYKTDVITESVAEDHLRIISEFHKNAIGFNGYMNKRLENYTGKRVENYKVYNKKLNRELKKICEDGSNNCFYELLSLHGTEILNRAESCIKQAYNWGYYDLINRSMKRIEICLGDTYHNNLCRNKDIEVINTDRCGYNMVEWDGIYYLNKLRKKGVRFNWKALISKFCEFEGIGISSEIFMAAMLSYPYEFMKCCDRYRYRKKDWSDEEYAKNLLMALEKDDINLLD